MTEQQTEQLLYDMSLSPQVHGADYAPLRHDSARASRGLCEALVCEWLNSLTPACPRSRAQWKKVGAFELSPPNNTETPPVNATFGRIVENLQVNRKLTIKQLVIPATWMDGNISLAMPFQAPAINSEGKALTFVATPVIGGAFNVHPMLDREGMLHSNVLPLMQREIQAARARIVSNSSMFFLLDGPMFSFIWGYLNACITFIDIMLTMIYYKAKFEHGTMGWQFDENKLGLPHGRRLCDKLKWVHSITGNPLCALPGDLDAVNRLRQVRNHFSHFDPPVLAYSIEDVALWLNDVFGLARLAQAIRKACKLGTSGGLAELLLLPTVHWVPKDPGKKRIPQVGTGYVSSQWPAAPA